MGGQNIMMAMVSRDIGRISIWFHKNPDLISLVEWFNERLCTQRFDIWSDELWSGPIGSRIDLIIRPMNQWDGIVAHSSSTSGTRVRWEEFDEKRAVLLEIEEREGKFSYKLDGFIVWVWYISMGNGKFWKVSWRKTLLKII